jgi:lipid-binding SYLF domain-containing protein
MKKLRLIALLLFVGSAATTGFAQSEKEQKLIKDADEAVAEMLKVDPGLREYFDKAAGCAVFPNVGKGGLIIGGASGNGVLYEYGQKVGMASLKELNVGLQAGGEALMEVIFFKTKEDVDKFKEGKFEFDAGVSATALKAGISKDMKYKDGVAVFTYTKGGLMADASVGGQKFKFKPFE